MVLYEGYKIVVDRILGSGQTTYKIEGLDESIVDKFGRTTQTTIKEAKIIIQKYLGIWVEPTITRDVMSVETFNQLQAGTLALDENRVLKQTIDQLTTGIQDIQGGIQDIDLQGLREKIQIETVRLQDIRDNIALTREGVVDTLSGEFQTLTMLFDNLTSRVSGATATVETQTESLDKSKALIDGAVDVFNKAIFSYQESFDKVLKELRAEQKVGFIKMIPYYVGAGLAVIIGVKVLDVMD